MSRTKKPPKTPNPPKPSPIYTPDRDQLKIEKSQVGISYLCKDRGFVKLYESARRDKNAFRVLDSFIEKARSYNDIEQMISAHSPRNPGKNNDKASRAKMEKIQKVHKIETTEMHHIHCCSGGSGAFVLHGFRIGNCFEIVWLDPLHEVHNG